MATSFKIPLHNNAGEIVAYAIVDNEDRNLAISYRWRMNSEGYAIYSLPRDADGKRITIRLHREILGLQRGDGLEGDHVNHNRLDNRRSNLRVVTHKQHMQNWPPGGKRQTQSQFRGVGRSGNKWRADITVNGKRYYLGSFADEVDAGKAAAEARKNLMPWSTS